MAKRKKSTSQFGCGTIILWIIFISFIVSLVGSIVYALYAGAIKIYNKVLDLFLLIFKGAKPGVIALAALVMVVLIACIVFRKTHQKPLSYEQIIKLSRRYADEYVKKNYRFTASAKTNTPLFGSIVRENRTWYSLEEPLNTFPANVATLLRNEELEWAVTAIEKEGVVKALWLDRDAVNSNTFLRCNANRIVEKCQQIGGYTIFRFHNHPAQEADNPSAIAPTELETSFAQECSEIACRNGINWYDFICSKGRFKLYYSQIADSFEVEGKDVSSIIDKIDIVPEMDYKMQKEYYKLGEVASIIKNKVFIVCGLLLIALALFFSWSFS